MAKNAKKAKKTKTKEHAALRVQEEPELFAPTAKPVNKTRKTHEAKNAKKANKTKTKEHATLRVQEEPELLTPSQLLLWEEVEEFVGQVL